MMNHENKRPVTLEDLLRLKRTERPPAEFWSQFDRELRAKQLSALVEQRPWWRTMPRIFVGFSRYHLPLGATAVLALTIASVGHYRTTARGVSPESAVKVATTSATQISTKALSTASSVMAVSREDSVAIASENELNSEATNQVLAATAAPSHMTQLVPMSGATSDFGAAKTEAASSERFIAANLAFAQSTEPARAQNFLGSARGFETRAMPARTPAVEPLAQMASPADARRSRLLGGSVMAVSMNSVPPARTTEVRFRRISDGQLYDTISRFDARGNSLLVKF